MTISARIISILALINHVASLNEDYSPISKPCHQGDIVENDCNSCKCTPNHIFECEAKPCNRSTILDTKKNVSCHPGMIYVHDKTVCLCKSDGTWPHDKCEKTLNSFPTKPRDICKPNSYVLVECNVCKCGPDGKLDQKRCTKNECKSMETNKTRQYVKQKQVYGTCEAKNWYSLAPCQFCYCVSENKLVCNMDNNYSKKLQLGSYNLSVCGKDLLKNAVSLIAEKENSLRHKNKLDDAIESTNTEKKYNYNRASIEFNRGINKKYNEQNHQLHVSKEDEEYDDYYSELKEIKVPIPIIKEGLRTKHPYDEENSLSVEFDNEKDTLKQLPTSLPASMIKRYLKHFDGLKLKNEEPPKGSFKLGDMLKPYLPVVLDKVLRIALRKSMVSVDAHSNCTPGATTVFNCNKCFCLKNNKLLCTDDKC